MTSTPTRVLVVDDELIARRRLVRLLSALPDVEIAGECERGDQVLARARTGVDVVLLDVEMPGLTGIEALHLWPDDGPTVVLCTAHPDHALAAFDGGAVDYLLKPVDARRLSIALGRARSRRTPICTPAIAAAEAVSSEARPAPSARLAISGAHGIVLLDPLEIGHLFLDGELVSVHARAGRFFSAESLSELHERLPAELFVRVHRRAIINLDHVGRFDPVPTGGFTARMRDGSLVAVSRQAARELRRRWQLR